MKRLLFLFLLLAVPLQAQTVYDEVDKQNAVLNKIAFKSHFDKFVQGTYASKQYWTWSDKAQHHDAVVRISVGNSGGTATHVGKGYFITAAHVTGHGTGRTVTCTWSNGARKTGKVIATQSSGDLACFYVPNLNAFSVPISCSEPGSGEYLEYVGFGGPGDNKRHFWGKLLQEGHNYYHGNALLLNGDSGGAVLYKGQLVATISGGSRLYNLNVAGRGNSWPGHYPARSCNYKTLSSFAQRCIPGFSCPPRVQGSPIQRGDYYPPPTPDPAPQRIQPIQLPQHPAPTPIPIPIPEPAIIAPPVAPVITSPQPQIIQLPCPPNGGGGILGGHGGVDILIGDIKQGSHPDAHIRRIGNLRFLDITFPYQSPHEIFQEKIRDYLQENNQGGPIILVPPTCPSTEM
jgi:hypothetical protein